ncbi:MAG TPA: alpha/beta hydrolase [Candidatus Bathyarchaeia archaeon]|nr:alpha/beta hydrolase [Candidatus Bathyarchaeia archaeon]
MQLHAKNLCAVVVVSIATLVARAEDKANPLDKAPSQFAKLDDIKVHYKSLGTGDTALVFVHGWTCNINFWRYQVPAFDGKMRMILIDLPGHGESDKPKIDYSMDLFAKSVDVVLKEAGVEKAVLAGHSMGTPVIRQFLRLYPKKTAGLIVVDGALRAPKFKPGEFDKFVARFTGLDWKETLGQMVDGMTKDSPAEARQAIKSGMGSAPQHVTVSAMKEMFNPAIWKDDEKIEVPLQVIVAKGPNWPPDYEQFIRKIAPQVDYHVMDGVGHFLMMEKPKEFNEIVAAFLKKEGLLKD